MLTSQDIKLITDIVQASEERISKKIDQRANQIIEYINPSIEDHETRISKLEDDNFTIQQKLR